MGVSAVAIDDRASVGRGRIRARFARQGRRHQWMAGSYDRSGENAEGARVRHRTDGSAVRVPATEGGAASERDPATGSLHYAGRTCLSHHRVR